MNVMTNTTILCCSVLPSWRSEWKATDRQGKFGVIYRDMPARIGPTTTDTEVRAPDPWLMRKLVQRAAPRAQQHHAPEVGKLAPNNIFCLHIVLCRFFSGARTDGSKNHTQTTDMKT